MEDVIFMKKRTVIVSAVSTAIIVIAGITSFSLNKPDVKMAPIEKNTQVIPKQGQIKSNGQSNKSESSSTQKDSEKSDNSKNTSAAIIASVVITLLVFIFFSYKNDVFYILLPFA